MKDSDKNKQQKKTKPKSSASKINDKDKKANTKKQSPKKSQNNKQTINTLETRNKSKIVKLKTKAKSQINIPEKQKPSRKTQGLANKIKQSNVKKIQKIKNTSGIKTSSNLNRFIYDEASEKSSNVEGILKSPQTIVVPSSKNNESGFTSNVIAKKSSLKLVTTKNLVAVAVVSVVLLLASVAYSVFVTNHYKFLAENPPFTLTKTIELELKESSASNFASITVPKSIVRGIEITQKVSVFANVLENFQVVRVKAFFTTGSGDVLTQNAEFEDDWLVSDDGYAYYTKVLKSGQKVNAIKSVQIPSDFEKDKDSKMQSIITINFETLTADDSIISQVWTTAPANFIKEW